jgi:hypothetical protein
VAGHGTGTTIASAAVTQGASLAALALPSDAVAAARAFQLPQCVLRRMASERQALGFAVAREQTLTETLEAGRRAWQVRGGCGGAHAW